MRLFVAILVPPELRTELSPVGRQFRADERASRLRWVPPEQVHLTVAFIGDVPEKSVGALPGALKRVFTKASAFQLTTGGLVFIPRQSPRVLAVSLLRSAAFAQLQSSCAAALRGLGLPVSTKPPHLTLARFSVSPRGIPKVSLRPTTFNVAEAVLMESTLSPAGPTYKVVVRFKLPRRARAEAYRPNVAVCVLNPRNEVLLVQHRERTGHWQLPQGGIDVGESNTAAVTRELREEVGIKRFRLLALREGVYSYRWPKRFQRTPDIKKAGFVGQRQSIAVVRVADVRPSLQLDPREAARTCWVAAAQLLPALNPVRRSLGKLVVLELRRLGIPTV